MCPIQVPVQPKPQRLSGSDIDRRTVHGVVVAGQPTPRAKTGPTNAAPVGIRRDVEALDVPFYVLAGGAALGAEATRPELTTLGVPARLHVLHVEGVQFRVAQAHCKKGIKKKIAVIVRKDEL